MLVGRLDRGEKLLNPTTSINYQEKGKGGKRCEVGRGKIDLSLPRRAEIFTFPELEGKAIRESHT